MASAGGHWVKVAQGNIGEMVFVPRGQTAAQVLTGRLGAVRGGGFPKSLDDVKFVKGLGGSTGAKLVTDENGNLYVMKRGGTEGGNAAGHLMNESATDNTYKGVGLDVPDHKIYQTPNGPVKLARFVEGQTLNQVDGALADKAEANLRKGFVVDALLGNWDVVGLGRDNVLVDKAGKVWRIDNGGALEYRAMGKMKAPNQFNQFPKEVWTMREQGSSGAVFKKLTLSDVAKQVTQFNSRFGAMNKTIPDANLQKTMFQRANRLIQLATAHRTLSTQLNLPDVKIEGFIKKLWLGLEAGTYKGKDPYNAKDILAAYKELGG